MEKTPHTVMITHFLYAMFPDMKYIHVVREPKDIYCSLLKQTWGPKQVDDFVKWYCYIMKVAYTAQSKIPEANYYVASFDNLVENTCEVVRDVLAFTSIKSSEEIINTCASQLRPELVHIDRWRQVLSDDETVTEPD